MLVLASENDRGEGIMVGRVHRRNIQPAAKERAIFDGGADLRALHLVRCFPVLVGHVMVHAGVQQSQCHLRRRAQVEGRVPVRVPRSRKPGVDVQTGLEKTDVSVREELGEGRPGSWLKRGQVREEGEIRRSGD